MLYNVLLLWLESLCYIFAYKPNRLFSASGRRMHTKETAMIHQLTVFRAYTSVGSPQAAIFDQKGFPRASFHQTGLQLSVLVLMLAFWGSWSFIVKAAIWLMRS